VNYNSNVTRIESIQGFKINPFENTDTKDVMNIKSLFDNFPDDFQTYAKPVLMFPSNEESLPKRAIVFYNGLKNRSKIISFLIVFAFNQKQIPKI
jgi:hypothetical protein